MYCHKLNNFPIFKAFLNEIGGEINKSDFLIVYNKNSQHLENLHNLVSQYFPK